MANLIVIQDILWSAEKSRSGMCFYVLQFLNGLERLGHRVLFLDVIGFDPRQHGEAAIRRFSDIINKWWHADQTALVRKGSQESFYGLDTSEIIRNANQADAVIQISAPYSRAPHSLVERVRPRVLIEGDPGYTHLWAIDHDPAEIFGEQDFYFTAGVNLGTSRCSLPTFGIQWRSLWSPVVLDWWSAARDVTRDRFTTVASWWEQGYLEFEGKVLGPKAEEFKKFINLPTAAGEQIEIALEIDSDNPDIDYLKSNGWRIEDPFEIGDTMDHYRDYVMGSLGEFSCQKGGYVGTRCGFFAERSTCYLASGRPAVVQSTGFEHLLPTGKGLFTVTSVEEATEAIKAIRRDYRLHSTAAREIAREFFDSDKVLSRLLKEVGI